MKDRNAVVMELLAGPPVISVAAAAKVLGIGKSCAYVSIKNGDFPAKTIVVGRRVKIVTASLVDLLGADAAA